MSFQWEIRLFQTIFVFSVQIHQFILYEDGICLGVPLEEHCGYRHPQYPYHGGGACSASCQNANYSTSGFNIEMRHIPASFPSDFVEQYRIAGAMLKETGLSMDHEPFALGEKKPVIDYDITGIHMTLDYFCCYSPLELLAIDEIVKSFVWPRINVSFDRIG